MTAEARRTDVRARRRWLLTAAIALPLGLLLALQLRTLAKLEDASVVAHRVTLRGYAKAVLKDVEDLYRRHADVALAVAPALLGPDAESALSRHFAAQDPRGVRAFFAVAFAGAEEPALRLFARDGRPLGAPKDEALLRAIRLAAAPWRVVAEERTPLDAAQPIVAEQDPANRLILRPVRTDGARVAGLVGLVVDGDWVRDHMLPARIEAERGFFPESLRDDVLVDLQPRRDPTSPAPSDVVEVPFKFVFTDWALAIRGRYDTPEQWARRSAAINLGLALALTGALGGAVLMALRNASRATELSQMKTEFVSNVSHELRTPLASIRVFGELLRLGRVSDPEKIREWGEYIDSESRRLTQLVDNILDFTRIESDRKRYRFEPADLAGLVEDAVLPFSVRLRQDGFTLSLRGAEAPLPPVRVDAAAVAHALSNLIDNAVKYSGDGRRIEVTIAREGGFATVSVADEGPGIHPDEHERIFEKFYRVGTGLVHEVRGSGLGLAIVRHVAEAHGGSVQVRSAPGAGSVFTLRLPLADAG
jgi:signal transduction histidine kinase